VLVLWGDHDRVLPVGSFEALCRAIGTEGKSVHGNHSWVLADPDAFGEVMSNVVEVSARSGTDELAALLAATSVPSDVVAALLDHAAPLWLMSEPPQTLAGDLALCHPPLGPDEVRAVAQDSHSDSIFRLTVVAHDRPGLLADTTALLAAEGLSVSRASATTWVEEGIALHSLTVDAPKDFLPDSWDLLAKRLRSVGDGSGDGFLFEPSGHAVVRCTPQAMGRSLLSVHAPDQVGLLWTVCAWLADNDVTIESMRVTSAEWTAHDEFIVKGSFDPAALAEHLSEKDAMIGERLLIGAVRTAVDTVRSLLPFR
jgi:glycine cleavage system regulatory protein